MFCQTPPSQKHILRAILKRKGLFEWSEKLDDVHDLRRSLIRSVDRDGSILDTASKELSSLRSKHRVLNERIHRRLREIVSKNPDDAVQDNFYTQRNQRYVVPVKTSSQKVIEGIVHDASSTGQTVFIEPAELVGPNNKMRMIEVEIEAEIIRILKNLADQVAEKRK